MKKVVRLVYAALVIVVVILGLLSRRIEIVPAATGDALWAMMIFFSVRVLLIDSSWKRVGLISLVFCYLVEFSQLYQVDWLNNLRKTLLGRLILGQGFLWTDLLAYGLGVGIAIILDIIIRKTRPFS